MPKEAKNQMVSFQYIHQAFLNARTIEQDAAILQRSFEDHVTGHIFLYMHNKRQQSKRAFPPETVTLQSGSKSTPGDLGLLILKERRWVNVLN